MKYFIYIRKSTESEDRQVMSLESQLSELREFAAKEKLEIVASLSEAQLPKNLGERFSPKCWIGFAPEKPAEFWPASRQISSQFHRWRKDYLSTRHRKNPRP